MELNFNDRELWVLDSAIKVLIRSTANDLEDFYSAAKAAVVDPIAITITKLLPRDRINEAIESLIGRASDSEAEAMEFLTWLLKIRWGIFRAAHITDGRLEVDDFPMFKSELEKFVSETKRLIEKNLPDEIGGETQTAIDTAIEIVDGVERILGTFE